MNKTFARLALAMLIGACTLPPCHGQTTGLTGERVYRIPRSVASVAALSARLSAMTPARVERIVDGDTIVASFTPETGLGTKEKIRLIGVDTPETVDPRKPVQYFGLEATGFTRDGLLGRTVFLAFEPTLRDYYGRLLAYVFLDDGTCFNLTIVAEGYGFAYTKYPFLFMDDFRSALAPVRL